MQSISYVYLHRRIDGSLFYVGKGVRARAYQKRGHNATWGEIASRGYSVEFLKKDIETDFALLLEREAIDVFIRRGVRLCNRTPGGEGFIAFRHSAEHRARLKGNKYGAKSGFYSFKGKHHSEEQKRIWSEKRKGIDNGRWKGKKRSPESIEKMRLAKAVYPNLWNRKFTDDEVREIRIKANRYRAIAETAREYGVGESTIRRIRDGALYRDVK